MNNKCSCGNSKFELRDYQGVATLYCKQCKTYQNNDLQALHDANGRLVGLRLKTDSRSGLMIDYSLR